MTITRIAVDVTPPYDVVIGRGVLDELPRWLPVAVAGATRAAVVTTPDVGARYASVVTSGLEAAGLAVHVQHVPDGEAAKSLAVLGQLYEWLASLPLARTDVVVALGGGVVTDLAGFLAATWHRGVPVLHLPTTVLAQVDAAIGGKTAVNLAAGKNLVGAFHQPIAVLADVATLDTLPDRDLRAGMAEVVKCGFIRDPEILRLVERDPDAALGPAGAVLDELIRRAVTVKAQVVASDAHEHGDRALLNYGHTLGHALEAITDYSRYRHGEAIAIGMRFAATVSALTALSDVALERRTVEILGALDLPVTCGPLDAAAVLEVMARDKKVRNGLRLVLCAGPGEAHVVPAPPRAVLERALAAMQSPDAPTFG